MGALIIRAKWHLARDSILSLGSLTTAASVPPPQKLWTTSCGSLARAPPRPSSEWLMEARFQGEVAADAHLPCPPCEPCSGQTVRLAFAYLPPRTIWRPFHCRRFEVAIWGGDDEESSFRLFLFRAAPARRHSGD